MQNADAISTEILALKLEDLKLDQNPPAKVRTMLMTILQASMYITWI